MSEALICRACYAVTKLPANIDVCRKCGASSWFLVQDSIFDIYVTFKGQSLMRSAQFLRRIARRLE